MKRTVELLLPALAVLLIVLTHAVLSLFPLPLVIPMAFLVLNRVLAGIPLRESAPRAYLMYFLTGLIGLLVQAVAFGHAVSDVVPGIGSTNGTDDENGLQLLSSMLVAALPDILMQTVSPLVCGVAVFIVFGGTSSGGGSSTFNATHLQQLNELLKRARIPEAAASLMQELLTQTDAIRSTSAEFSQSVGQSAAQIGAVGTQAAGAAQQFAALSSQTASLTSDLLLVRQKITEMQSDVAHLHATVAEIGQVVDQFSEIAASRILNFTDESDSSDDSSPHSGTSRKREKVRAK